MTIRLHRGDLPDLSRFKDSVAIDTETMGLKPHRDRLCVVQLSSGDGSADVVQIPAGPINAPNLKKLLGDDHATLTDYRIHDFRVTCESRLADLGFNQDVRDAVLGHAKVGLQRTYNKHDYADEKRRALDKYAEHIMGVVGG